MGYILSALIALTPTYVIRFSFYGVPLNLLEIVVGLFLLIFIVWEYKKDRLVQFLSFLKNEPRSFFILLFLFLLSGIISTFISPETFKAAGQFLVLFLLPLLVYYPAKHILREENNKRIVLNSILILIGIFSIYAIIQYITLLGLPEMWQGNSVEPKRAISFFKHPNGYALWLAPLLALAMPYVFKTLLQPSWKHLAWIIGTIGLILSQSRGGLMGLIVAAIFFVVISKNRQLKIALLAALLLLAALFATVPVLKYRVLLPFQGEKSTVSRFSYWHTANKMIAESPVFGKGLHSFQALYPTYNTDPNLDPVNYPHNIFLNFLVEFGAFGLIVFMAINAWILRKVWRNRTSYGLGVVLFLLALFVHGQIDIAYLKNDLALIYWIVLAFI